MLVLLTKLNIILGHLVWTSLTMGEVGEWSIIVGISAIVSPLVLIRSIELNIILSDFVWTSLSMSEVSSWSIVIGISRVVSPLWFIMFFKSSGTLLFVKLMLGLNSNKEHDCK